MEFDDKRKEKYALYVIAIVLLLWTLKEMRGTVLPVICAVFVYLMFFPLVEKLKKKNVHNAFIIILFSFLVLILVAIFFLATIYVINKIMDVLPKYVEIADITGERFSTYLSNITKSFVKDLGVSDIQSSIGTDGSSYFNDLSAALIGSLKGNLAIAKNLFNSILLIFVYDFFLILEHDNIKKSVQKYMKPTRKVVALELTIRQVSHYMSVKVIVSFATGLVFSIIMIIFRMDGFLMWGVLTFIFNFIPVIGSIVVTLMVALFAFLQFGFQHQVMIAFSIAILCTLTQFIIGNILDPKLTGDKLNISSLLVLLSLAIWGYVFGIVGMIIAVPITCMIKNLMKYSNSNHAIVSKE